MSVEPIELIWVVAWLITLGAFVMMEQLTRLMARDQRRRSSRGGPNGTMTVLARWLLWLFRLLALAATLMLIVAIPSLFLPPTPPRPVETLAGWQRTVAQVGGWVGLIGLFGATAAILTAGVMSLLTWRALMKRGA